MNIGINSCRLCLKTFKSKKLKEITSKMYNDETISDVIYSISGIRALKNCTISSKFPSKVCLKCVDNLSLARQIRKLCIDSDKYLRTYFIDDCSEILDDIKCEPQDLNPFIHKESELGVLVQSDFDPRLDERHYKPDFPFNETDYFNDNPSKIIEQTSDSMELFPKFIIQEEILEPLPNKVKKIPEKINFDQKNKEMKGRANESEKASKRKQQIFQCAVCGKICKDRTKLNSHERCHEEKPEKRFECDLCGRLFALKSYIFSHMSNIHIEDKKYKCEYCGKNFAKIVIYRNHRRSHTNEKPFLCSQCPKAFSKKQLLEIHNRVHTGERPYKCKFCEKTYAHYTDLRRHSMTHTGERPYICKSCGKGFIKRSCLTSHEKTHLNAIQHSLMVGV